MPIRPHLNGQRFDSDTIRVIGPAFEMALVALRLTDRGDLANEVLAHKIIELAQAGERDPERLCDGVLLHFRQPPPRHSPGFADASTKLLHHDPVALDFVQIKLDGCGCLGRCNVERFDRTEDFTLVAQQDHTPAALHPTGELDPTGQLGGGVFLAGSAGHSGNIPPALPGI